MVTRLASLSLGRGVRRRKMVVGILLITVTLLTAMDLTPYRLREMLETHLKNRKVANHMAEVKLLRMLSRERSKEFHEYVLPARIFIYWNSGLEDGPFWLKDIAASWRERNPGYEVIFLDNENVLEWCPAFSLIWEFSSVHVSHTLKSDYLRLYLLVKYGGVWVDSTVYNFQELDGWLPSQIHHNGMYVPLIWGEDGQISTWFLASEEHIELFAEWLHALHDMLFRERPNKLYIQGDDHYSDVAEIQRLRGPTEFGSLFLNACEVRGFVPYYLVHACFNVALQGNPTLAVANFPRNITTGSPLWFYEPVEVDGVKKMTKCNRRVDDAEWKNNLETFRSPTGSSAVVSTCATYSAPFP